MSPARGSRGYGRFCPLNDTELLLHQKKIGPFDSAGGIICLLDELRDVLVAYSGGSVAFDAHAVNKRHLHCSSLGDEAPRTLNHDLSPIT